MKILKIEDFKKVDTSGPGRGTVLGDSQFVLDVLTSEDHAKDINGFFISYPPGTEGIYHFHKKCESLMIIISGEGVELVEGEEKPIKKGDVIYIPAMEKHSVINRSQEELRFFEFHTGPPVRADKFKVE